MSRIACLRIPRFPIVVHQKQEPELRGRPLILINGKSKVVCCSSEAGKRFLRAGMRLSEARAVCADLAWRNYEERLYVAEQKEILANLVACSPRISSLEPGVFLMDADGLAHLGGEGQFCRNLLKFISRRGYLDCNVGIADSAYAASVASRNKKRKWCIVPRGSDSRFLSHLPVDYLPVGPELKDTLRTLGIERMGQFTALPADEIQRRFAEEGMQAYKLASGIDRRYPALPPIEKSYQCFVDIGGPIESFNDTLFLIKSMIERLTLNLRQEDLTVEELIASFYRDDQVFEERTIPLIRPSNNSKFLLEVLRLSLENNKLEKEFSGLRLSVSKTARECAAQLAILSSQTGEVKDSAQDNDEEAFLLLMQKMNARFGKNVLLQALPADQYILEAAGKWQPIVPSKSSKPDELSVGAELDEAQVQYVGEYVGKKGLVSGLVLKRSTEPVPILMEFRQSKPHAFNYQDECYRISAMTIPECLSGSWWETPVRKSYYTALVRPGSMDEFLLFLLAYDHERRAWFLEGEYD